nr:isonicotinate dehydrogenase=31 kda subunit {N-terminal} [Mycobacterium, INA1, Peptide Partial, 20 aa] [Mycobacterium]
SGSPAMFHPRTVADAVELLD